MNKRIIIGSVLVLTLLLLMPSIPAVQHNVVKDEILNDIQEKISLSDITELLDSNNLDKIKHPILYLFVILVPIIYFVWGSIVWKYLWLFEDGGVEKHKLAFMILFCYGLLLNLRLIQVEYNWINKWQEMSDKYGWNWNVYDWKLW